jgi:hypothetical protein
VVLEELGEFFGGELAASGVEKNNGVGRTGGGFFTEFEECGFVGELKTFRIGVALDAFYVVAGQGPDGGGFGFADPSDFEFHEVILRGDGKVEVGAR